MKNFILPLKKFVETGAELNRIHELKKTEKNFLEKRSTKKIIKTFPKINNKLYLDYYSLNTRLDGLLPMW